MGLISISFVNVVFGCVCRFQYVSAMPSAEILASGGMSLSHSFVLGMSITPSMIAWATCTPWGANSRAMDWDRARMAYLAVEKEAMRALDLTEAVAPVKIKVGGYLVEASEAVFRRRGRVDCEKRKAPLLPAIVLLAPHMYF